MAEKETGRTKRENPKLRDCRSDIYSIGAIWYWLPLKEHKGYSTITSVRGVVKTAFQMAYNEDIIRKNPFDFKLVDIVPNDSQKRIAMTEEQQEL